MTDIQLLVDGRNNLGEGPLWDVAEQRLYWIDSLGRKIFRIDADGQGLTEWSVPGDIGSMALRAGGGAVLSLHTGFHTFDFDTGQAMLIHDPEPGLAETRLNDGKVDRRGRFLAGSMHRLETEGQGSLYRLDADHSCHKLDGGIMCSNAPAFSPDGRTLYFADSVRRELYAYDYDLDSGHVSNKRLFVSTRNDPGAPDGGTVDADGCVWSAQILSGRIVRYTPAGKVDRIVEFPVATLTSVMFGGPNLDILYVTTMGEPSAGVADYMRAHPLPEGKLYRMGERGVGGLFAVHGLGVQGIQEPRYAG
ncbi:MAG: SMP-30/gluconolactonase/LRE family protein [Comamonadaceae bacterium]|nr:MAG: SMP-30/gluconolactonase/LRE family protein [Comamonadaceae bacterium]